MTIFIAFTAHQIYLWIASKGCVRTDRASTLINYKLWVATSDTGKPNFLHQETRASYAWVLREGGGKLVEADNSALGKAPLGHHDLPLFSSILAALGFVQPSSSVVVYSDLSHVRDLINLGPDGRTSCNYKRSNGKPFADAEAARAIDRELAARSISLTAEEPANQSEEWYAHKRLKDWASEIRANIGKSPGDWERL